MWPYITLSVFLCLTFGCQNTNDNQRATSTKQDSFKWRESDGKLGLLHNDNIIWQLNFVKSQDKPYFHPLRTIRGYDLTLERPDDHPWHRGLWFSWKDINGVNYWEEDSIKGVAEGRSIIQAVDIETNEDSSAEITISISYEEKGKPMLTETRVLTVSSPSERDGYTIGWHQTFVAKKNIRLYLEKPAKHGGVEWGGYAGLSFRAAASLTDHHFLASNGWTNEDNLIGYGEKAAWMDMTAKVDGTEQEYVGLTIFDHPQNPRYPSPWYIWFAEGQHAFFTPSLLFDEPMYLNVSDSFSLQYLTLIHDQKKTNTQLNKICKSYIK